MVVFNGWLVRQPKGASTRRLLLYNSRYKSTHSMNLCRYSDLMKNVLNKSSFLFYLYSFRVGKQYNKLRDFASAHLYCFRRRHRSFDLRLLYGYNREALTNMVIRFIKRQHSLIPAKKLIPTWIWCTLLEGGKSANLLIDWKTNKQLMQLCYTAEIAYERGKSFCLRHMQILNQVLKAYREAFLTMVQY